MKQQKITRREFFKASIKRTLPILGAIALGRRCWAVAAATTDRWAAKARA